jgi:hypothetical protein
MYICALFGQVYFLERNVLPYSVIGRTLQKLVQTVAGHPLPWVAVLPTVSLLLPTVDMVPIRWGPPAHEYRYSFCTAAGARVQSI